MEEKKNIPLDNEMDDKELDTVAGGAPIQSGMKSCASYGCRNLVPANGVSPFCEDCQKRMHAEKFRPIL